MKFQIPFLSIGVSLLTLVNLLPQVANGKKDEPTVEITSFKNGLEDIFYFDDSNVLLGFDATAGTAYRSDDAGGTWEKINDHNQAGNSLSIWPHPFDNQRAYIIGEGKTHWLTKDQGKTWKSFASGSVPTYFGNEPLKFHGRDPKKVIWNGEECSGRCQLVAYYTDDDFATTKSLGDGVKGCQWAVSTPMFGDDIADKVEDRIFCVKNGLYGSFSEDNRLMWSDDYFDTEKEPPLDNGRAVKGVISMAAVKKYIVAATKSEGSDELALYVTIDGDHWHRAEFGEHKINEDAYTILESTNYSMQVDVLGSKRQDDDGAMGFLFTSNSNGTYFTRNIDYTNRNFYGRVDFEKVQNIQGIILVNVVENAEAVESRSRASKKVISKISFDDGRTFEDLKADGKKLHLHSVTDAVQNGRIFSSPAPGIVMGVGNTGDYLKPYKSGDLFVSDDAGRTWRKALDGPHMYEFGNNGAVLVAVVVGGPTQEIRWSLNHGKDWQTTKMEQKFEVTSLTTVPDSTTLKFLMSGAYGIGSKREYFVFKIDFEGLNERTCKDKDFETWTARVDDDGKASCVMGHKQYFKRRKAEAECFIDADFKDPQPEFERCKCTARDFECDFNFARDQSDDTKCNPLVPLDDAKGKCKKETDTFKATSGFRLIPGNECDRKGGDNLDEKEIDRPCKETVKTPASGEIEVVMNEFDADRFGGWYYVERADGAQGNDETIIMQNSEQKVYISRDHGKKWTQILKGEPIKQIVPNPHFYDRIYFLTATKKVFFTVNRGDSFGQFEAPRSPVTPSLQPALPLKFHRDHKDWLLWSGFDAQEKYITISFSRDRGDDWQTLSRGARKCEFIHRWDKDELIYCEQYEKEDPSTKTVQLLSSENFFADTKVLFPDILDFATMAEFIIVAAKEEDQKGLKVDASVNGVQFAQARFPSNFKVDHQQAYTVLDSSTHAVFLHVTVNGIEGQEYGTILKSNSNGTSYVLTHANVNRNAVGYVDFEKMQGLEGVAMINVVSNIDEVDNGNMKKLKSRITHNDGSLWAALPPPKKDALGKDYECVKKDGEATEECSLHIHSYTERMDKSATFSSPSAVGLMMAVGNVGPYLNRKDSEGTDTFITRDAGITWTSVMKGSYLWEYGDQGSIIVIVPERTATRVVFYTLDEGKTWTEFPFSETDMEISAITTVPSDNSFNFLLWGRATHARGTVATVNLDFSGLTERQRKCKLEESDPEGDDYYLWRPQHPLQNNDCLFGHKAQYHRKRPEADCYNGKRLDPLHKVEHNCTCTRQDYECAYNFELGPDGNCQLVPNLQPLTREEYCKANPGAEVFSANTAFRRIPLTTCVGGDEYDKVNIEPCPGYEEDFKRKHGIGGAALFFAIVIPIAAACGVGYWVWQRYKTYGFGHFGQIRLGDAVTGGRSSGGQSPLIAIPVAIIAGLWAVAKAIPLLTSSLFRSAKGYAPVGSRTGPASGPYRSRDAFSRRQDYTSAAFVEDDELLGEDDEVDGEDV